MYQQQFPQMKRVIEILASKYERTSHRVTSISNDEKRTSEMVRCNVNRINHAKASNEDIKNVLYGTYLVMSSFSEKRGSIFFTSIRVFPLRKSPFTVCRGNCHFLPDVPGYQAFQPPLFEYVSAFEPSGHQPKTK